MEKRVHTTMDPAAIKSCHAKSAERREYEIVSSSLAVRLRDKMTFRKSFVQGYEKQRSH